MFVVGRLPVVTTGGSTFRGRRVPWVLYAMDELPNTASETNDVL